MVCIAGPSCGSDRASNSDPEPGTPSRCRSPTTPPWIDYWAEALQSPRSSLSSNARYVNWVEQHQGESRVSAASRRHDAGATSVELCDSQACWGPPRRRSPRTPRMLRPVEAQTRTCAKAAPSSSEDHSSDPHRTQGLTRRHSRSSRRPRQPPRPEETSLHTWFEAQVALRLLTLSSSDSLFR